MPNLFNILQFLKVTKVCLNSSSSYNYKWSIFSSFSFTYIIFILNYIIWAENLKIFNQKKGKKTLQIFNKGHPQVRTIRENHLAGPTWRHANHGEGEGLKDLNSIQGYTKYQPH